MKVDVMMGTILDLATWMSTIFFHFVLRFLDALRSEYPKTSREQQQPCYMRFAHFRNLVYYRINSVSHYFSGG